MEKHWVMDAPQGSVRFGWGIDCTAGGCTWQPRVASGRVRGPLLVGLTCMPIAALRACALTWPTAHACAPALLTLLRLHPLCRVLQEALGLCERALRAVHEKAEVRGLPRRPTTCRACPSAYKADCLLRACCVALRRRSAASGRRSWPRRPRSASGSGWPLKRTAPSGSFAASSRRALGPWSHSRCPPKHPGSLRRGLGECTAAMMMIRRRRRRRRTFEP